MEKVSVKRISQSRLKKLLGKYYNPEDFFQSNSKTTKAQAFGLAVEKYLFDPSNFDEDFIQITDVKPTGKMLDFCNYIIDSKDIPIITEYDLLKAYESANYSRSKLSAIKQIFFNKGFDIYVKDNINAKTKMAISAADSTRALVLATLTQSNKDVLDVLKFPDIDFNKNNFQKKITFRYREEIFVIILDYLLIDEKKQEVTMIDLKVIDSLDPNVHARRWRWDIQAALYSIGVEEWLKTNFKKYTLNPFKFIVVRKGAASSPVVMSLSARDSYVGLNGDLNKGLEGLNDLIDKYKKHKYSKKWKSDHEGVVETEIWPKEKSN